MYYYFTVEHISVLSYSQSVGLNAALTPVHKEWFWRKFIRTVKIRPSNFLLTVLRCLFFTTNVINWQLISLRRKILYEPLVKPFPVFSATRSVITVQTSVSLIAIQYRMNPIHTLSPYFHSFLFITVSPSTPRSLSGFPTKTPHVRLWKLCHKSLPTRPSCYHYSNNSRRGAQVMVMFTTTSFQHPISSFFRGVALLFSTLFSKTHSLHASSKVTDHDSQPDRQQANTRFFIV